MVDKFTAKDLVAMLAERHSGREWAFVTEVPNGTASRRCRVADAMAMGLWAKTGIHLHGFEVKIARSDWRKELEDSGKSSSFEAVCHYWWIVAPKNVVNIEEIPATWGWLYPEKDRLRVAKKATFNQSAVMTYDIYAATLRRAQSVVTPEKLELESIKTAAWNKGYQAGKDRAQNSRELLVAKKQLEVLQENVRLFKEQTGIDISTNNSLARTTGEIVNLLQRKRKPAEYDMRMQSAITTVSRLLQDLHRDAEIVEKLLPLWPEGEDEGTVAGA